MYRIVVYYVLLLCVACSAPSPAPAQAYIFADASGLLSFLLLLFLPYLPHLLSPSDTPRSPSFQEYSAKSTSLFVVLVNCLLSCLIFALFSCLGECTPSPYTACLFLPPAARNA
ncbi:hypothetical protein F5884DRAFT_209628 [Xylogone sp. PMI_703]|nr:hypothetical protein F5884DRAFT_209628 [Xylogone sp. PMI_703]